MTGPLNHDRIQTKLEERRGDLTAEILPFCCDRKPEYFLAVQQKRRPFFRGSQRTNTADKSEHQRLRFATDKTKMRLHFDSPVVAQLALPSSGKFAERSATARRMQQIAALLAYTVFFN